MTIIRRGITGFDADTQVDPRLFKKAVFAFALETGREVVQVTTENTYPLNFYSADLTIDDEYLGFLCNHVHPVAALVKTPYEFNTISAITYSIAVKIFHQFGFTLADNSELNRNIDDNDISILGEAEKHQMKYWKPSRIYELIFNMWD